MTSGTLGHEGSCHAEDGRVEREKENASQLDHLASELAYPGDAHFGIS